MDFKEVIQGRRAVNFFDTQRQIPDALLREMVETAALAPSSFNLQPWSLIVVKNPDEKMKLRKLAWDQPKVSEAPVIFIVLALFLRRINNELMILLGIALAIILSYIPIYLTKRKHAI